MVADALSRKGKAEVPVREWKLVEQLETLRLEPVEHEGTLVLSSIVSRPELYRRVREEQIGDIDCEVLRDKIEAQEVFGGCTEVLEHSCLIRGI